MTRRAASRGTRAVRSRAAGVTAPRRRGVAGFATLGVEERHQRIRRRQRDQVEDEPVAELGDRLQRERLRGDAGLEVEHDAQRGRRLATVADAREVADRRAGRAARAAATSGPMSTPSRSSTTRSGSFSVSTCHASGAGDSRITRVYSCAGQTRADAMRAACAHAPARAAARAGSSAHASARRRAERDADQGAASAAVGCRSRIVHRPSSSPRAPVSDRPLRSTVRVAPPGPPAAGSPPRVRAIRPAPRSRREALRRARRLPFLRIGEPIKIKVIQV